MSFKQIPFGSPEAFNAVIEIPKGCANKYEYNEELDVISLNWVFKNGLVFPFDYGYVPGARGGDGDHLDVFVLNPTPLGIGTIVLCRPIGMIELLDRGEKDDKIIAVPLANPDYRAAKGLQDLTFDYEKIFREFFKELGIQKNKTMEILSFADAERALKELEVGRKAFG